ncbi:M50 family metallopeptidase [Novipirellula artificiosorum]|uniref:Peptidase family M50 n=1 Tax=Novipirellula artificiosorum TaxID=2528016 RepID=A0A5C6E0T0_9BACT|nr:M50 family metallopeptidase [Novipirellula artificiosorum]TWU42492.1 hypothetical protein Poly41_07890 [Novipirellula artificiosorum]
MKWITWLLWCWTVMTLSHEVGHVIGGWASGAAITDLELRPWHLPHSLFQPDPHPIVTLWSGPILGCVVPCIAAAISRRDAWWLVAWFCVLANATYMLVGWFSGDAELDTTKMIQAGTPPWLLLAIWTTVLPVGYVKFRERLVQRFAADRSEAFAKEHLKSAAAWAAVFLVQSIVGELLAALF